MKSSTITKIGSPREWTGQHGKVFFTDVVLSDGVSVSLGRKTPNGIKAGDPVNYEVDANGKAKEIRQQPYGSKGGGYRQDSTAATALQCAKDLAVANIGKADKPLEMDQLATKILKTADRFNAWLKANQ